MPEPDCMASVVSAGRNMQKQIRACPMMRMDNRVRHMQSPYTSMPVLRSLVSIDPAGLFCDGRFQARDVCCSRVSEALTLGFTVPVV